MSNRFGLASLAMGVTLVAATGIVAVVIDPPLGSSTTAVGGPMPVGLLLWLASGVGGFVVGVIALIMSRPGAIRSAGSSDCRMASSQVDATVR